MLGVGLYKDEGLRIAEHKRKCAVVRDRAGSIVLWILGVLLTASVVLLTSVAALGLFVIFAALTGAKLDEPTGVIMILVTATWPITVGLLVTAARFCLNCA